MNEKQIPEWEEDGMLPEDILPPQTGSEPVPEDIPEQPAKEAPVEAPAVEEAPLPEAPEEEIPAEEPAVEEILAEEPAAQDAPAEEAPVEDIPTEASPVEEVTGDPTFMDRIPDVEEDYPQAPEEPDEAMRILDDPQFRTLVQPPEPEAEVDDREYRDNGKEFDEMFHTGASTARTPSHSRPTRKGRPKRKKGEGLLGIPNILVTVVWLALILFTGVTLGRMLWVCAADVLAFGREDKVVTVTIYEADSMDEITEKLHDAGLIRYKSLFNLYASISDAEEDIQPGIYDLNTRYDYHALVNFMSPRSSREVVELTIPEGYTCRQIFNLLEENRVCTVQDLKNYCANGELEDYWFLENVERGSEYCLEGFLFPDTYQFYKNSSPREAIEKLLDNFDYRFTEEMRGQIDTLNSNVTGGGYSVREIVIVASLIEKETAGKSESPMIASVIYNRLFNWDYPAYLNIDAAIIYAQSGESDFIDTSIDSPYNTYLYTGLTPTPIANPGLASLKAALNPETSNYYYYVLNPATGKHQFSTTQEEHNAWIAKFYND